MNRFYVDRSRVETYQRCHRKRWLEYHEQGTGIVPQKKALPLAVGGSVHEGLALLLGSGQLAMDSKNSEEMFAAIEERAVKGALEDFAQHRQGLELDLYEQTQMAGIVVPVPDDQMRVSMAASLGMDVDDTMLADLQQTRENGGRQFDEYLWKEQSALVEAIVRAYARRKLRPLLEEYEVLEVEREGEWVLTPIEDGELVFMSRPDALLRGRADNGLYIQSFKTAAAWDVRKARDAEHDMQGLSEGVDIERRLTHWWQYVQEAYHSKDKTEAYAAQDFCDLYISSAMRAYLRDLTSPPRILGIRYEYLLKGERWKDKELSQRVGFEARSQKSHLIRQYVATSVPSRGMSTYSHGDVCWSWDFIKEDGTSGKLAWQNWDSRPVWDRDGGVKAWIDQLAEVTEAVSAYDSTVGLEPRLLGYAGPAQKQGYTKLHPLDAVFPPVIIIYRQDDDLRDWIEQLEAQERDVAEGIVAVNNAKDADERRSAMNQHFVQSRNACEYPGTCSYVKVCYGGEDIRRAPLDSGVYKRREVNHPQEKFGPQPLVVIADATTKQTS